MAAKLVAEEGSLKGLVLSLDDGDQWIIGRDPDACQLLIEDPSASRKHLVCRTTPKGILVENLSDTNPIQVNKEEIKTPRLLHHGDAVKIGDGIFRFYAEDAAHLFNDEEIHEKEQLPNKDQSDEHPLSSAQKPALTEHSPEINEELPGETAEEEPNANASISHSEDPDSSQEHLSEGLSSPKQPENKKEEVSDQSVMETPENTALDEKKAPPEAANDYDDEPNDSIFDEEPGDKHKLAEINFGLLETGRWLLKVISGPNNGAEFSMQAGNSYIIGTDPNACDIVFHDTSVSRQHTRITINPDDTLVIEDLKSRNGTLVDGERLQGKSPLPSNTLVSLGTTSFVIFDREGEMQTIISPLMPSIVKTLQVDETKKEVETPPESAVKAVEDTNPSAIESKPAASHHHANLGAFILIGILTGLFLIVAIGTTTLFKSEPVAKSQMIDPSAALNAALGPFPSVKYTFNPNTGQLLLVGHVLTTTDKNQMLYALQGMPFIKSLDDSGVVIDEYVWREINQVLENNPEWKGINVMAVSPGHFVISGYLKTRSQADQLAEYLNANFPYPDLLEKRTVVDQEVLASVNAILQGKGLKMVTAKLDNGEISLTGGIPQDKVDAIAATIAEIREIRGVRNVRNGTTSQAADQSVVNISDKYEVTGISNLGGKLSVVINGRILMKGDILDGMTVTQIQPNVVFLQRDGTRYRIDYNR